MPSNKKQKICLQTSQSSEVLLVEHSTKNTFSFADDDNDDDDVDGDDNNGLRQDSSLGNTGVGWLSVFSSPPAATVRCKILFFRLLDSQQFPTGAGLSSF